MGLFSSKKTTVKQEPLIPDFQLQTGEQVADWLMRNLARYTPNEPYTGPRVAGMSQFEQTGLGLLDKYLQTPSGTGDLFGAGKQQIMDTLGGKYADPTTNPFIQAMTKLSGKNLQDSIDQARGRRGARGTYFSRAGIQEEGDIQERVLNNLNAIVGQTLEGERGRQFAAAPIARSFDEYEGTFGQKQMLDKVAASQQFGALPRTIEQAQYEADYQDFLRARGEMYPIPGQAISLYGTNVPYGLKELTTKSPSTAMAMLGEVIPGIGSYNTHQYGYTANQSSLSEALKAILAVVGQANAGAGGMPTSPGYKYGSNPSGAGAFGQTW